MLHSAWYLNDSQRRQAGRNEPSLQHLASHPEHPFPLDGRGIGTADGKAAGVRAGDRTGGSSEAHEPVSVARDRAQAGGSSGDCTGVRGQGGVQFSEFDVRADRDHGNAALPAPGVNGRRRKQLFYKASGLAESPARDNHVQKTDMVRGLTSF